MAIYYYKLFDLLNRKGLKKGDLMELAPLSSATMAKLVSNKVVKTDILSRICLALNCQPGDIMESLPDEAPPGPGESASSLACQKSRGK